MWERVSARDSKGLRRRRRWWQNDGDSGERAWAAERHDALRCPDR